MKAPTEWMKDEIARLNADLRAERVRANEAAKLSAEARDLVDDLRTEISALQEHIASVEGDRLDWTNWCFAMIDRYSIPYQLGNDEKLAIEKALAVGGRTLQELVNERIRQDEKFPDQHLPDGTAVARKHVADLSRRLTDQLAAAGELSWSDVLREEYNEALAEVEPGKLRVELIQLAAVAVRWVQDLDSRGTVSKQASE